LNSVNAEKAVLLAARREMNAAKGSHDWEHTERVLAMALHIAKKERADLRIVRLAALLHDIARSCEDRSGGRTCHAQEGAKRAGKLLRAQGIDEPAVHAVTHCIETHRFRGQKRPVSKEAKVLYDADKLDSIGAVGIGRAFLFAGEVGAKLHNKGVDIEKTRAYTKEDTAYREYMVKLRHVKDRMLTKEGRRLARERHAFMKEFFTRLNREVTGVL